AHPDAIVGNLRRIGAHAGAGILLLRRRHRILEIEDESVGWQPDRLLQEFVPVGGNVEKAARQRHDYFNPLLSSPRQRGPSNHRPSSNAERRSCHTRRPLEYWVPADAGTTSRYSAAAILFVALDAVLVTPAATNSRIADGA